MAKFRMEYENREWIVVISDDKSTVRVALDEFARSSPCKFVVDEAIEKIYSTFEFGPPSAIDKLEKKLHKKYGPQK